MPDVHELAALVGASVPRLGRARLVSIDGPAGSGKSTMADALAAALEPSTVVVLHMDDLYDGWTGLNDELEERLLAQVIRPLAAGGPARWQRYDWHQGQFADWHDLAEPAVLVLEGCGSGALAYQPFRSALVWVEAEPATRLARGIERDGEQVRAHWLAWMRTESQHFAANRTRERADAVVNTD